MLTKFAYVESRLSGLKRQREVVFYVPVNLCDRRVCSASVAVGLYTQIIRQMASHSLRVHSEAFTAYVYSTEIWTTPENVHLVDVVGGNAAFCRDRACSICTVGAEGGFSGWAGGEEC